MSSYKRDKEVKIHCYVKKDILTNNGKKEIIISLTIGLMTNDLKLHAQEFSSLFLRKISFDLTNQSEIFAL